MLKRDELVAPSRLLIREGELTVLARPTKSGKWAAVQRHGLSSGSSRTCFLFNDMFVVLAPLKNRVQVQLPNAAPS